MSFTHHVLASVGPEAPLELRRFSTAVKTDSRGRVITGQNNNDPVKTIVGAELAGTRAGLPRYTKIMATAMTPSRTTMFTSPA